MNDDKIVTETTAITETKTTTISATTKSSNSEILLILEDTVKCYQTEDTPYVISNAASITDLHVHTAKVDESTAVSNVKQVKAIASTSVNYATVLNTPEKPINYCEEGTPDNFSRYDSLSSLDEPLTNNNRAVVADATAALTSTPATNLNSAQETPLMFSRHSSMDSLIADDEDEIVHCDDKSSVVSDFSRLASGVISPSEIPDSPTQSMPQSPRRNSIIEAVRANDQEKQVNATTNKTDGAIKPSQTDGSQALQHGTATAAFDETIKKYCTEDTPALLSKVGSTSNLSVLSICSSVDNIEALKNGIENENQVMHARGIEFLMKAGERRSLNLSDDVSSNASESGMPAIGQHADILQQCIRDGMKKKSSTSPKDKNGALQHQVSDNQLLTTTARLQSSGELRNEELRWHDDSLSSLSIESEDDTNLLSQAIAAGCNRPKSNLGFSTPAAMATSASSAFGKTRLNALSKSQPIPIDSGGDMRQQYNKRQGTGSGGFGGAINANGNESFSSVDSCDSNDNQSKLLLELCILTGKHKRRGGSSSHANSMRQHHHHHHNHHHHHKQQNRSSLGPNASKELTQSNPK